MESLPWMHLPFGKAHGKGFSNIGATKRRRAGAGHAPMGGAAGLVVPRLAKSWCRNGAWAARELKQLTALKSVGPYPVRGVMDFVVAVYRSQAGSCIDGSSG